MFKDQNQSIEAEQGSNAIQAGRDINIHSGLNLSEVKELTQIFLDRHLPALRAEAAEAARHHANVFMNEFVNKLHENEAVSANAFAKPDSQACFSDALKSSAEKGDQIDLGFLATLVIKRLEADEEPLAKLAYEDAVKVVPRLTSQQIAFICYVMLTKNIQLNSDSIAYEYLLSRTYSVIAPGFNLSVPNREYLAAKGVLTMNLVADGIVYRDLIRGFLPDHPEDDGELKHKYPYTASLIDQFQKDSVSTCFLTATGKIIGITALERVLGKLNASIWIH